VRKCARYALATKLANSASGSSYACRNNSNHVPVDYQETFSFGDTKEKSMNFVDRLSVGWATVVGGWILFTVALGNDTPHDKLWSIFLMLTIPPWLLLRIVRAVFTGRVL
jgi:hypothetical protein